MKSFFVALGAAFLVLFSGGQALAQGGQIYQQHCSVCHGNNGQGASGPNLAGNNNLADDAHVIQQILYGGQAMPPFANTLSDEEIATVATTIRTSWGNDFGSITAEQVASSRIGAPGGGGEQEGGDAQAQAEGGEAEGTEADGGEADGAEAQADQTGADQQDQAGQEQAGQSDQGTQTQQSGPQLPADIEVATASLDGQNFLVGGDGTALYRYVYEAPEGEPRCYDSCNNRWIPLLVGEGATAGEGVEQEALGTAERDDGALQVTYKGWPLYRFVNDEAEGAPSGDIISDVWTSVDPAVGPVEESVGLPVSVEEAPAQQQQDTGQEEGDEAGGTEGQ